MSEEWEKIFDDSNQGTVFFEKRQLLLLIILTISSFIVILDFASIFIPLPTIMEDLNGTLDQGTWIIVAFILAFVIFLLPCASLADYFGKRRFFLIGILLFTISSVASALAPSMEFLIGARVFLGIGAAMMEYSVYTLIRITIPANRQNQAFKIQGAAFIAGAIFAPLVSGAITTLLSWDYIFWLNMLVGILIFFSSLRIIPDLVAEKDPRRLDLPGLTLSATGLFLLFFAIIEGARFNWNSPLILGSFGAAVVLLTIFVIVEFRVQKPTVDLRLFKDRLFGIGNVLRGASEFTSMGIYFGISHFMQVQLGYSALFTGLLLVSVIVGGLVASVTEPLSKRFEGRWLIVPGFLVVAGGTFWLAHVTSNTAWTFFIAPLAIAGAGFTVQEGPTMNARDRNIQSEDADGAWRISYTILVLSIGLGVSVVSAILQSKFISNIKVELPGSQLSPGVSDIISSALLNGEMSSNPAAFSNAVNTSLLSCVVVSLLGAGIALFFSTNRKKAKCEFKECL